ncbi:hypothetical protein EO92_13770 [Methanosarcina sp. 2.H.A.1B.4]|nr:hypothetical protein EO92_13770 [Methanosarcina sp. 2.H.A.1B.4]
MVDFFRAGFHSGSVIPFFAPEKRFVPDVKSVIVFLRLLFFNCKYHRIFIFLILSSWMDTMIIRPLSVNAIFLFLEGDCCLLSNTDKRKL